jgi:hypothetical protein
MKDLLSSQKLKKSTKGSDFINMSGRFQPIPSFLNDKSLNELIEK